MGEAILAAGQLFHGRGGRFWRYAPLAHATATFCLSDCDRRSHARSARCRLILLAALIELSARIFGDDCARPAFLRRHRRL